MLKHVLSDQSYAPELKIAQSNPFVHEPVHTNDAHYLQYQCVNCGEAQRPGELICINCGMIISATGKTEKLDRGTVERPDRIRRVGELVGDDQKPIMFLIDTQPLSIPVAQVVVVGRKSGDALDTQPDIDLTPFNAHEFGISRRHVRLTRTRDLVRIADLGSLNGTYLNGFRLAPQQDRVLRDGDEMFIGKLRVRVQF